MPEPIGLAERGLVPDGVIRRAIRRRLARTRASVAGADLASEDAGWRDVVAAMDAGPIAVATDAANDQHYELPPAFFEQVLGPWLKYSAGYWPEEVGDLAGAEEAMLALTAARAGLADGQEILELGCGWGSLSLWAAQRFPRARVTAVSNAAGQAAFIRARAEALQLTNLTVHTADMNDFAYTGQADRVVSLEMFEHMRNHRALLARIHDWLKPGGQFFLHIFAHARLAYFFDDGRRDNWMARNFFTGGLMPSADLPLVFQDRLKLRQRWRVDGRHYARTLEAWLARFDRAWPELQPVFAATYGRAAAPVWRHRWRLFFLACAELFAFGGGRDWFVSHYLFERPV